MLRLRTFNKRFTGSPSPSSILGSRNTLELLTTSFQLLGHYFAASFDMAILKDGTDEYEVCIKRHPQKITFEEYVKIGDRPKPDAKSCTRYIVGEEGVTYTVEVTLRKGFIFGDYTRVDAKLCLPGQKDPISSIYIHPPPDTGLHSPTTLDVSKTIEYADVELQGRKMLGTRFAFRSLVAGESLFPCTIKHN